jgi:hypothetical protein
MTKDDLAIRLDGREIGKEMTKKEEKEAKDAGLVVVFGASDDLMEFRGVIHDEVGVYDGGKAVIYQGEIYKHPSCEVECAASKAKDAEALRDGLVIEAIWCAKGEPDWTFKTSVPHASFLIQEGDERYCRGIVFELK